jgi:nitrile hydratase subunit beta
MMFESRPEPTGAHDLGGKAGGPIDQTEKPLSMAEKRVDALILCLTKGERKLFSMDEHRYAIERIPAEVFTGLRYYEKWLYGLCILLDEQGLVGADEIRARVARIKGHGVASGV